MVCVIIVEVTLKDDRSMKKHFSITLIIITFLLVLLSFEYFTFADSSEPESSEISTNQYDSTVVEVLEQLDCPSARSLISDSAFCSGKPIEESELVFVQAWYDEKGIVELYADKNGGYLASLRNDDRIYCAQYVNGKNADDLTPTAIDEHDIYIYEYVSALSGLYRKGRYGYFLDGKELTMLYYSPVATKPDLILVESRENLLSVKQPKTEVKGSDEPSKDFDEENAEPEASYTGTAPMYVYYNPNGGLHYHADPNCPSVSAIYLPLAPILYSELNGIYSVLTPCRKCNAPEKLVP